MQGLPVTERPKLSVRACGLEKGHEVIYRSALIGNHSATKPLLHHDPLHHAQVRLVRLGHKLREEHSVDAGRV